MSLDALDVLATLYRVDTKPKKPSGRNVHDSERHTAKLTIRCSYEILENVRVWQGRGFTLAEIIHEGCLALHNREEDKR